ncbi:MAG: 50S ribosomal protein L19e [Candidatus Nanohaloarchaea archaeon]
MSNLKNQKRMAAEILDVGENRVKIDPEETDRVEEAITRQDIRNLIESGAIEKRKEKGTSRGRAREKREQKSKGRRKGHGKRKGKKTARKDSKEKWMENIRAIRNRLKEMREDGELEDDQYWSLYDRAKGGFFRDTKHLENFVENKLE